MAKPKKHLTNADQEWQRKTREKIKTTQLLKRLVHHALGTDDENGPVKMEATQIRAAEILLDRALPKLSSATLEHTGEGGGPIKTQSISFVGVGPDDE